MFQWFKGGAEIPGTLEDTLEISSLKLDDTGWYSVTVTDAAKRVNRTALVLVVIYPENSLPALRSMGLLCIASASVFVALLALRKQGRLPCA